ncbi:MAG: chemotaxis protein CheW [Lachnospiraceae bacterium]|nr:chemotaxis protein CheW [Lachnospiraceae bacterium]
MANELSTTLNDSTQYIVIRLGTEQYGIDIRFIDNIVRMQQITRVPQVSPYWKGVINLRGEVIPVLSLRVKMGMENDSETKDTRIIIIKIDQHEPVGVMVDSVKEVVNLSAAEVERVASAEANGYVSGVGKQEQGLISILDTELVLQDM